MRSLAAALGVRPTKQRGQNFVIDANTVRRIVRAAELDADDVVLEVGPGLGSLTLACSADGAAVTAVEIDPVLAAALPRDRRRVRAGRTPTALDRGRRPTRMRVATLPGRPPTALVANLPYNVAVPVLLHLLASVPVAASACS